MPIRERLSRRRFLKLGAAAGAAAASAATLGSQVMSPSPALPLPGGGSGGDKAGRLRLAFAADARTFGQLIGPDGQPIEVEASAPAPAPDAEPRRWVMVIDLARCDGCRLCTEACTAMHLVPQPQEWIKVLHMQDNDVAGPYWFPKPCFQCDNSPCTKICPVGATYKREDGIVMLDQERCIGCRYCVAACPYSSRFFNWAEPPHNIHNMDQPYDIETNVPHRKGVAEKCLFCPSLLREGQLPACVAGCPMGAMYVGDELEDAVTNSHSETVSFSELVRENGGYRYLEELGTQPRVYYLPPRGHQYPLPPFSEES